MARLVLEAKQSFEEGATFVSDGNELGIDVAEEQAIDSYNASVSCHLSATREQAIQLRDWLIAQYPLTTTRP